MEDRAIARKATASPTPPPYTFDGHSCVEAVGRTSVAQRAAIAANRSISAERGELTIACACHDMCPEQTVIYYSETEARANLLFICRACNCHDDLVAACGKVGVLVSEVIADRNTVGNLEAAVKILSAIIVKAKA